MTRGGKRGKLKQRVSPSSHRAWKSGRPRRIPTFPQRRRRLLHRHNFQTTPQQFQHFVRDLKETFWGDLYGKTRLAWKEFLEEQSRKERDRSVGVEDYERAGEKRRGYRNGFYERDFVTRLGTLRLRVARSRDRSFRPPGLERFQRRAAEGMLLIREAFLHGISTRQVGRVVAILTGEVVSAQTVSALVKNFVSERFILRSRIVTERWR